MGDWGGEPVIRRFAEEVFARLPKGAVDDQTEVEIRSHEPMAAHLEICGGEPPGFAHACLPLIAPQLGVPHARHWSV